MVSARESAVDDLAAIGVQSLAAHRGRQRIGGALPWFLRWAAASCKSEPSPGKANQRPGVPGPRVGLLRSGVSTSCGAGKPIFTRSMPRAPPPPGRDGSRVLVCFLRHSGRSTVRGGGSQAKESRNKTAGTDQVLRVIRAHSCPGHPFSQAPLQFLSRHAFRMTAPLVRVVRVFSQRDWPGNSLIASFGTRPA
jgi:hypothetical protein